jgi:hypothetical protein
MPHETSIRSLKDLSGSANGIFTIGIDLTGSGAYISGVHEKTRESSNTPLDSHPAYNIHP